MKTLILGMGNSLLSDDAIGLLVVEELHRHAEDLGPGITIRSTQTAGFRLVDLLEGFDYAIVVDAVVSGDVQAGTPFWFDISSIRTKIENESNHNLHLADALKMGNVFGLHMPRQVDVLAIEVEDCFTFSESVSPAVERAVPEAIRLITEKIKSLQ